MSAQSEWPHQVVYGVMNLHGGQFMSESHEAESHESPQGSIHVQEPAISWGPKSTAINIRTPCPSSILVRTILLRNQFHINIIRAFTLLPFFAAVALSVDNPSGWALWGDSGNDNCGQPSKKLDVDQGGGCQRIPGDYKSYHFTDEGGIKIGLYAEEGCGGEDIGYQLKGCIRPGTLEKAKYFQVCWR